jgi:hypothetical protein
MTVAKIYCRPQDRAVHDRRNSLQNLLPKGKIAFSVTRADFSDSLK